MTGSAPTPDLKGWFKAHRRDFAANGFTDNLMRRLPPRTPLLPQLTVAVSIAAGLLIYFVAVDWESVISGALHVAATAADAIPAAMLWLNAAVGNALQHAANLRDLLPALAVGVAAFYLVTVAGVAILASTLIYR
ncbi:MAG: DUF5056 domain-containing protein [Prevotellaceae bacterium]|nr:DUF5056 domain-containing protein [Prevotellaceae bacterium]